MDILFSQWHSQWYSSGSPLSHGDPGTPCDANLTCAACRLNDHWQTIMQAIILWTNVSICPLFLLSPKAMVPRFYIATSDCYNILGYSPDHSKHVDIAGELSDYQLQLTFFGCSWSSPKAWSGCWVQTPGNWTASWASTYNSMTSLYLHVKWLCN